MNTRYSHPRWGIAIALITLLLALAGCISDPDRTYRVEGKVTMDGQPATALEGCRVILENPDRNLSAEGEIRDDGSFALTTFEPDDGVPAGTYRVIVVPPEEEEGENPTRGRRLFPPRYEDYATSELSVIIQPDTEGVSIALQSR